MAQNQYSNYYPQQQYPQRQGYPNQPQQPQLQRQATTQYADPRSLPGQRPAPQQHGFQPQTQPQQIQYPSQPPSAYAQQQQQQTQLGQTQQGYARAQQTQQYYAQQPQVSQAPAPVPAPTPARPYSHPQPVQRASSFPQVPTQPQSQAQQQAYYQAQQQASPVVAQRTHVNYSNQQLVYTPPSSDSGSRYAQYALPVGQIQPTSSRPIPGSYSPPKPQPGPGMARPPSANGRPLPIPKARPESMPPVSRHHTFPNLPASSNVNSNPIQVAAPTPSSPTRPAVLNTPPGSISSSYSRSSYTSPSQPQTATPSSNPNTSSPTRAGGRPLPTPVPRGNATKHMSMDLGSNSASVFGSGLRMASRSPSPEKRIPSGSSPLKTTQSPTRPPYQTPAVSSSPPKPASPFKSYRPIVPPPIIPEALAEIDQRKPGSPTKFVPLWKRGMQTSSPSPERPSPVPRLSYNSSPPKSPPKANGRPLPSSPSVGSNPNHFPTGTRPTPIHTNSFNNGAPPMISRPSQPSSPTVGLYNGAAPMGNRPPPPQHPNKKDIPPPPGKAFLSPRTRKTELAPLSDDEYMSANEGDADVDGDWEVVSERSARSPSPQYGIRDLPRSGNVVADRGRNAYGTSNMIGSGGGGFGRQTGRDQSPKPPLPSRISTLPQPLSGRETQPRLQQQQQGAGPARSMTLRMAAVNLSNEAPSRRQESPTRQQPAWIPGGMQNQRQAQPLSSNANAGYGPRGQQREMVNLDDAPPPSLRMSPAPGPGLPIIRTSNIQIDHPQTPPALPPRRWTPTTPTTTTPTFPTRSRPQPPRTPKVESPVPVGGRGSRPDIPTISFPDDEDSYEQEEDHDFGGGPSIMISGPDEPEPPRIAVSAPQISISGSDSNSAPRPRSNQNQHSHQYPHEHQYEQQHDTRHDLPLPPVKRRGGMVCGGCDGAIIGRIVSAMGVRWHPGCFRCTVCNELLEHVSSYEHEDRPYCHLDYHENFAPRCYHCKTSIVDERFITLDDPALGTRTYHEQHFFCAECGDPFLAPRDGSTRSSGELNVSGDGVFEDDDVGFTVYKGHPYCEACHVRLRLPKCKRCKKSIRDGAEAVEALGGKWCWECFTCASCEKPFDDPSFFERNGKPFCETCFSLILRNEV